MTAIEAITYSTLLIVSIFLSYRKGEKEGSKYMLAYLRKYKYKDSYGNKQSYLDDTGFNMFMGHIRKEKEKQKNEK